MDDFFHLVTYIKLEVASSFLNITNEPSNVTVGVCRVVSDADIQQRTIQEPVD